MNTPAPADLSAIPNQPPDDPLAAIRWHADGIDGFIYDARCDIATYHLIAKELAGIDAALKRLAADSVPVPRSMLTHAAGMIEQFNDQMSGTSRSQFAIDMVAQLRAKAGEA